MSRISRLGKLLLGIGVLVIGSQIFLGRPRILPGGPEFVVLVLLAGGGLYLVGKYNVSMPSIRTGSSLRRGDILRATNWARVGRYVLRRSFGIALAFSAGVLLLLALALQDIGLATLFILLGGVGVFWIVIAWRKAHGITEDHTESISVRAPNGFALHSFHIALRQRVEDLGYTVVSDTSPGEGGSPAPYDGDIYHADGGFRARHRPVEAAQPLTTEIQDDTLNQIFTVATLGVFVTLLGITLVRITESLAEPGGIAGALLVIVGLGVVVYDYVTRTREWGELYCVEEGTLYAGRTQVFSDQLLTETDSRPKPTVSSPETGAVLSITLGAKRSSLYAEDKLEDDFESLVDAIQTAAADHHLDLTEATGNGSAPEQLRDGTRTLNDPSETDGDSEA